MRKSKIKEKILEILKEKEEVYRFELRNYGISTGGSLTRVLRALESEGKVKIVDEKIVIGNSVQRVKKIVKGEKFAE